MVLTFFILTLSVLYGPIHAIGGKVCDYEGKMYPHGADISRADNNCYGLVCHDGGVIAWDGKCSFMTPACPGGVNVWVDGQCCPVCMSSTAPPPPTTSSMTTSSTEISTDVDNTTDLMKGCKVNGRVYAYGKIIMNKDKCERCVCSSSSGFLCEPVTCSGTDSNFKVPFVIYFAISVALTKNILFCYHVPW